MLLRTLRCVFTEGEWVWDGEESLLQVFTTGVSGSPQDWNLPREVEAVSGKRRNMSEASIQAQVKHFQAATVCFTEALELLSKSNEAEKIKKDFTAILHVSETFQ